MSDSLRHCALQAPLSTGILQARILEWVIEAIFLTEESWHCDMALCEYIKLQPNKSKMRFFSNSSGKHRPVSSGVDGQMQVQAKQRHSHALRTALDVSDLRHRCVSFTHFGLGESRAWLLNFISWFDWKIKTDAFCTWLATFCRCALLS